MATAWYLSKTIGNSNNYVDISIPAPTAVLGQYDFTIEFEVQLTATDLPVLHASALDASVNFYFVNSSGNLDIRTTGNTTTVTVNGGDKTQWNKYRVRHYTDGGVNYRQVYYNDVLKNTYTINVIPIAPILFVFKVSNAGRTGNLKTISFTDANAPANNKLYDANLSSGVGTTLPPDGTLQGALSWVEYDDGTGGSTDYDLEPESGVFSYSGGIVQLLINRSIAPDAGIYNYSGGEVNLSIVSVKEINPEPGVFAYTGSSVDLLIKKGVTPEPGQFSYAGGQISLTLSRIINLDAGLFNYSGGAVDIQYTADAAINISPEIGIFSYQGGQVDLLINRFINPQAGNYEYQGGLVAINTAKSLTPQPGQFNYFGSDFGITIDRVINPLTGLYSYTGGAVSIAYSGLVVRRITNYSVSFEQDYVAGQYGSDFVSGYYENDHVSGFYEDIE